MLSPVCIATVFMHIYKQSVLKVLMRWWDSCHAKKINEKIFFGLQIIIDPNSLWSTETMLSHSITRTLKILMPTSEIVKNGENRF